MSIGKYSPTVSSSYRGDKNWFQKNGGGYGFGVDPQSEYDNDGYDMYGYNEQEVDRAGVNENDYHESEFNEYLDEIIYPLFEKVQREWSGKVIA